jgi:hypothetical protein
MGSPWPHLVMTSGTQVGHISGRPLETHSAREIGWRARCVCTPVDEPAPFLRRQHPHELLQLSNGCVPVVLVQTCIVRRLQ